MGRTSQEDELDDLRANLAEDPELADAFARLEAAKDSRRERRSGSDFGNPLKGFVPVESVPSGSGMTSAPSVSVSSVPSVPSVPSERAVSSRSGLPSFHDTDDDAPPDTPTRRYVKSEHADPSLGEPPPSTHRTAAPPKRGALPKPAPPPARASAPGPMSAPRGKPNALVYGPVSSPNGAPSAPEPLMPVNSGPVISVRNTEISLPPDEYGARVTPVVGAPPTPASPAYPSAPSSSPIIDPGFALQPIADSTESVRGPELPESDARAVAPPVAAPAIPADEREGSGTRIWLLLAATLVSAAATVAVLMFVVRPLKPESAAAPTSTAITAAPPANTPAPVATVPPPPPAATAPAAPTPVETVQPPPTPTAVAATPPTPTIPGAAPTPGGTGFVPQFTKQQPGGPLPTARPPATAKPTATPTAAPKAPVSPIFEFER